MDDETRKTLREISEKIDRNHEVVLKKFHGERGDNGVYGRLQSLEHWQGSVKRHVKSLWALIVAVAGGVAGVAGQWFGGGK